MYLKQFCEEGFEAMGPGNVYREVSLMMNRLREVPGLGLARRQWGAKRNMERYGELTGKSAT
jgi:hypothetical protein